MHEPCSQRTPLHSKFDDDEDAAFRVAQLLIDANADVNAVDVNGHTPCLYAAMQGHGRLLQLMIAAGGNLQARDSCNAKRCLSSPLIQAWRLW
jgi:hypothetical protein